MGDARRATPATDTVLRDPRLAEAQRRLGRDLVKRQVQAVLQRCRDGAVAPDDVLDEVLAALPPRATALRPVLNATGVLIHTNLGRAPLSSAAVEALVAASGTTDMELDLATGVRGPRGRAALAALRAAVPAAQAVHVVNNGAAALALACVALAAGREIVVARGELVEIGDGFRIPELVESVGVTLREVGTTNRVTRADYEHALTERTALVLKVHPSNFVVSGFTASVPVQELATLPVPVVADIGSGLLVPHPRLPEEPDATSALRAGATLVTASGDKLLGGPQCGLLLGSSEGVQRLRRHPLARALRVDKLTLAALEATLAGPPVPARTALEQEVAHLQERAAALREALLADVKAEVVPSDAVVGGGGAPGVLFGSAALSLPAGLGPLLRAGDHAVMGRVEHGRLLLDLFAIAPEQDGLLLDALRSAVARLPATPEAT